MTDQQPAASPAPDADDLVRSCGVSDQFSLYLWHEAFGGRVEVVALDEFAGLLPPVFVARITDAPGPGYTMLATLTGSRFPDSDGREAENADGAPAPVRTEYVVVVRPGQETQAHEALAGLVRAMVKNGVAIPEGATAPKLFSGVRASGGLIVANLFGYSPQPMQDRVLEVLQLLPITKEEEEYAAEFGYQMILDGINAQVVDSADLTRLSLLYRTRAGLWDFTLS